MSLLVEHLPGLSEGHVEGIVDVDDALLRHGGDDDGSFKILLSSCLSFLKILLKSA